MGFIVVCCYVDTMNTTKPKKEAAIDRGRKRIMELRSILK